MIDYRGIVSVLTYGVHVLKNTKLLCPTYLLLIAVVATAQEPKRFPAPPIELRGLRLPTWQYKIVSPSDGNLYTGYMVGTSPFRRGARTTTIPVILVPFIVQFTNTTSGFSTTFDPSTAPDAGCTGGQTAMSLIENSPIFQSRPWTLNGVDVGATEYIDAFQRSNFWQVVGTTGIPASAADVYRRRPADPALNYRHDYDAAEIRVALPTPAQTPRTRIDQRRGLSRVRRYVTLENAMTDYISSHHITPNQLPIFILYNVGYSQNGLFYLGGYHFSEAAYPQALTSPGQTFIIGEFPHRRRDLSMFHPVARDRGMDERPRGIQSRAALGKHRGNNGVQTGPRSGRSADPNGTSADHRLEWIRVPLAGTGLFFVVLSHGVVGAGGLFSDNGTFGSAGPVCM